MRALIIGYGRAGKRHARYLETQGFEIGVVEPFEATDIMHQYASLPSALKRRRWDYAVVCTPPDLHLGELRLLAEAGIPTLCEKPLCGLGQLKQAQSVPTDAPIMLAYNYRYHPQLAHILYLRRYPHGGLGWGLVCNQHRPGGVPNWGLLLDHCSHDLDMLNWLAEDVCVISARHDTTALTETWSIYGQTSRGPFFITERVWAMPRARQATLIWPNGTVEVTAPPEMYTSMWQAFLSGQYWPGIKDGIATQRLLEAAAKAESDAREEVGARV